MTDIEIAEPQLQGQPVAAAALSTAAPALTPAQLQVLARRLYGIDGSAKSLAGERDQNCRLETADGRRYVLKISKSRIVLRQPFGRRPDPLGLIAET
jgi:hypothetical protein